MGIIYFISANKIKEYIRMQKRNQKKHLDSFLNNRNTIELPSNLLSHKKESIDHQQDTIPSRTSKMVSNQARLPKQAETPSYIE